jgi:mRNA interferase MazF
MALSDVLRGNVYLANLNPGSGSEQSGIRPVVVVSRDALNKYSSIAIVCPLTDAANKKKIYPSHVLIPAGAGGLKKDSIVATEQVRAVNQSRFMHPLGRFDRKTMLAIEEALKISLDLS